MKLLWAPWRKIYIASEVQTKGCFFCKDLRSPTARDPENHLLHRSRHAFILLNRFPYTNGHLMVAPNRHVSSLEKLSDAERLDFLRLSDLSTTLLKRTLKPQGFNLGINLGRVAGAGIPGHVHLHIVPRWKGDTNFMPILTGTKVISDSLEATYRELRRSLRAI